jgi:hypothetical protein
MIIRTLLTITLLLSMASSAYANRALDSKLACLKDYVRCEMHVQGCTIAKYGDNSYAKESENTRISEDKRQRLLSTQSMIDDAYATFAQQLEQDVSVAEVDCSIFTGSARSSLPESHCCLQQDATSGALPTQCTERGVMTIDTKISLAQQTLKLAHEYNNLDISAVTDTAAEAQNSDFNPCNVRE